MYLTLAERDRREALRRGHAAESIAALLQDYARQHGGRFLLCGSAAEVELEGAAWKVAEELCWRYGMVPDIRLRGWCRPGFLARLMAKARVLS
jgi:hypothetical protein